MFNPAPKAEISTHFDGDEVLEGMVITTGKSQMQPPEELAVTWKMVLTSYVNQLQQTRTVLHYVKPLNPEDTELPG